MKPVIALVFLASLAACGADGLPEAPASKADTATGLTISGCAKIGVTYGVKSTDQSDC